jgi:hypothetical protein
MSKLMISSNLSHIHKSSEPGKSVLHTRRTKPKHFTPVIKRIKVTVGSQSASFKLETELLVGRKAAAALMRTLHARAKSLTTPNETAHPLPPSDFSIHSDIAPDLAMDFILTPLAPEAKHFPMCSTSCHMTWIVVWTKHRSMMDGAALLFFMAVVQRRLCSM